MSVLAGWGRGVSVIDLNGFGAGTGNPAYDPLNPIQKGNSNYPNNPNLLQANSLIPPLALQGTCTFDGGSEGVFSLTKDSNLEPRLLGPPLIESVGDMALGAALDLVLNNAPPPFGCQAGGGNLCAGSSIKLVVPLALGANTLVPGGVGGTGTLPPVFPGLGNLASWAPHPNPPPLQFPPLCVSPAIGASEPTSVDSSSGTLPTPNLLGPSANFLGDVALGIPPSGLPTSEQNGFFQGPSGPQVSVPSCSTYQVRQQIGFFLYVIDRTAREIVVLNSNRFTVLDRIALPDPTSLAMSPNLDFLAVTNRRSGTVSFISTDPSSANFHQVVKTTHVGTSPSGLAWEPGNEDLLVCNEGSGSVSIISAFDFKVRKTVQAGLSHPFEIAVTQRQANFGLGRDVYFAFILNRDGSLALFESGPNVVNGWGFDDIVGVAPFQFAHPTAIALDPLNLDGGCWILHENPLDPATGQPVGSPGDSAVTNVVLESTTLGQLPLGSLFGTPPVLRDLDFAVRTSVGPAQLTGKPIDIAFDNMRNLAGLPNIASPFSAGAPARVNGKGQVKQVGANAVNVNEWTFLFLAIPNSDASASGHMGGVVDVIDRDFQRIDTDPFAAGVQSIPAPGVNGLMDYFRQ